MRYLKDIGFIIKRFNIGEADRFITLFTKNNGKIEVVGKGVRKISSKRASHIELLNLVKFQSVKTRKNNILTEVEVIDKFEGAKTSFEKLGALFLICELLDSLSAYGQKSEYIFELVKKTLDNIGQKNIEKHIFNFQVNILSSLGFWDLRNSFRNEAHLTGFIEEIIERKIKSKALLY